MNCSNKYPSCIRLTEKLRKTSVALIIYVCSYFFLVLIRHNMNLEPLYNTARSARRADIAPVPYWRLFCKLFSIRLASFPSADISGYRFSIELTRTIICTCTVYYAVYTRNCYCIIFGIMVWTSCIMVYDIQYNNVY